MMMVPDTVVARVLLVLIIGLTLSHALSVALYLSDRSAAQLFAGGQHIKEQIVTVDRLVNRVPLSARKKMAAIASDAKLQVTWTQQPAVDEASDRSWQSNVFRDALVAHFGENSQRIFRVKFVKEFVGRSWHDRFPVAPGSETSGAVFVVSIKATDDGWLNFAAPVLSPEPFWSLKFSLSLLVMLLAVTILSAFVVRQLTRPLTNFAAAAQRLGLNLNAPPLPEIGPMEVRHAAHAFNKMQDRIRRLVEDRMQMVAAISHDLGTPITRLRLRLEFVENEEQKRKMLADLNDMEMMINAVMSFARDEASNEPRVPVDLRTLIQRVCDDTADAGNSVRLRTAVGAIPYTCQPVAMRRAITNLVNNAVNYGHKARLAIKELEARIEIQIDDDGPGIPEESQEDVFKPFQRMEGSRSRETGGVGLGLSVARTIIRGHGGDICLENLNAGGLRATVWLPRH